MTLNTISELVTPHVPNDSSESLMEEPSHRKKTTAPADTKPVRRSTRNKGGAKAKEVEDVAESIPDVNEAIEVQGSKQDQILVSEAVVKIPSSERLSADSLLRAGVSPGRSVNKIPSAASGSQTKPQGSSRKSARRSLVGLRHSVTQEAVRRASRRSFLKKKARLRNLTCSSSISGEDICMDVETEEMENREEQVDVPQMVPEPATTENRRVTRSMARTSERDGSGGSKSKGDGRLTRSGSKRHAAQEINTPKKKRSPPKECLTEQDQQKRDALNKKIEQENEPTKKIEEKRQKKLVDIKRKRDERLKRVVEVQGKEQEKKKKIEEKMAKLEKKNDMLCVERLSEEKAKRKVASKRQEELELRKKQREAARQKKLQKVEEEERRHQEMLAKLKVDEEREKAHRLAKAARALELKKEQERKKEEERERERERERQAAAEKEKEKAIALQKELERAAREKERREMEEHRKAEEEREAQQKHAVVATASVLAPSTVTEQNSVLDASVGEGDTYNKTIDHGPELNVTVDIENSVFDSPVGEGAGLSVTVDSEQSPQSYQITPKGQKVNPKDFGMDQNSDDSTDDESAPVKPIPSWAEGMQVKQAITEQYYNPLDLDSYFGEPELPRLEEIFRWTKSCFFKRTSSAVRHASPRSGNLGN